MPSSTEVLPLLNIVPFNCPQQCSGHMAVCACYLRPQESPKLKIIGASLVKQQLASLPSASLDQLNHFGQHFGPCVRPVLPIVLSFPVLLSHRLHYYLTSPMTEPLGPQVLSIAFQLLCRLPTAYHVKALTCTRYLAIAHVPAAPRLDLHNSLRICIRRHR
jgi:hypothetical protein